MAEVEQMPSPMKTEDGCIQQGCMAAAECMAAWLLCWCRTQSTCRKPVPLALIRSLLEGPACLH
jgi:hypothetical protein